jgi:predicted dehydrogenase
MMSAADVDLVAIASRTKEKAEAFRTEFGLKKSYGSYEALLADPEIEAVHITVPNGLHAEWMLKAIEAGKHILCEKSFAADLAQAQQVARAAAGKNLQIMEAFVWRHHPQHERAMKALEDGVIGKVRLIRAAFTFQLQQPSTRFIKELGGGCLLDAGCYPVSASRFYMGSEPTAFDARGYIDPVYDIDMHLAGMLLFDDKVSLLDVGFDAPFRTDFEIVGDKGRIYFPKAWQPPEVATIFINEEAVTLPTANQYVLMFDYFSRCILDNVPTRWGIEDAIKQARALEAGIQTVRTAQLVAIQES